MLYLHYCYASILIIFYHLKLLINSNILKLLINFKNKLRENWRPRDEIILTILKYNFIKL